MNKKVLLPIAIWVLVLTSAVSYAASTGSIDTTLQWKWFWHRGWFAMQSLTTEQKTKLDSLTTREEKDAYIKSIVWTWVLNNNFKMWKWMWKKAWFERWEWRWMERNVWMTKLHKSLEIFFVKLDKDYTDNTKKTEVLNKVVTKIDSLLSDTTLSESKKRVYTHLKDKINKRIDSIEAEWINIDSILNVN